MIRAAYSNAVQAYYNARFNFRYWMLARRPRLVYCQNDSMFLFTVTSGARVYGLVILDNGTIRFARALAGRKVFEL